MRLHTPPVLHRGGFARTASYTSAHARARAASRIMIVADNTHEPGRKKTRANELRMQRNPPFFATTRPWTLPLLSPSIARRFSPDTRPGPSPHGNAALARSSDVVTIRDGERMCVERDGKRCPDRPVSRAFLFCSSFPRFKRELNYIRFNESRAKFSQVGIKRQYYLFFSAVLSRLSSLSFFFFVNYFSSRGKRKRE